MEVRELKKCPKCGSRYYKRSVIGDIEYTYKEDKKVKKRCYPGYDALWTFKCLKCGFTTTDNDGVVWYMRDVADSINYSLTHKDGE